MKVKHKTMKDIKITSGEIWKDIDGYEGMYQVSSLGRIKSIPRFVRSRNGMRPCGGEIMGCGVNNGYRRVSLSVNHVRRDYWIHILVARAFIGMPVVDKKNVNHINHKRDDNRLENLEYVSTRENLMHARSIVFKKNKKSKYSGITKSGKMWMAQFYIKDKKVYCERFSTEIGAHNAYLSAMAEHGITNKYVHMKNLDKLSKNINSDTVNQIEMIKLITKGL